jgi:hypothetical protein
MGYRNEAYAAETIRRSYAKCQECAWAAREALRLTPSFEAIIRLRGWLETAKLPPPPLVIIPGVVSYDVELTRRQILAQTVCLGGDRHAVLELRYLAARYGPPEIRALAKPDQLPGDPRGPQF